ncbi:DUF4185 domain-containing protein [Muriicola sp. SD30]|uniref:DUF4185 domain-containing protein n=1 Tax=Muriicola sp. SD30 TaxID=3240936 RepID=UPI00350FC092
MRLLLFSILFIFEFILNAQSQVQSEDMQIEVYEVDTSIFTTDKFWRGADGAASIDLENGKILWLFSDTFIDPEGTGKRSNSKMINNSIAIQEGDALDKVNIAFYYKGKQKQPKSFFELPGKTWFWTGHGILANDTLIIFLFEEKNTNKGIGFEAIGWYIALIDNPFENPLSWNIRYIKGSDTFGVIVGSSAVLKDKDFIYAYGVSEPSSHLVYLLRFPIDKIVEGDIAGLEWWNAGHWITRKERFPIPSQLFIGQTEFSVHYQENLHQYVQIQTYGYGAASIGYRLAEQPEGPWSQPVIFYNTQLKSQEDFVYSANAHPEISNDGILVTYNINSANFKELIKNDSLYFPKFISIKISK